MLTLNKQTHSVFKFLSYSVVAIDQGSPQNKSLIPKSDNLVRILEKEEITTTTDYLEVPVLHHYSNPFVYFHLKAPRLVLQNFVCTKHKVMHANNINFI